jgi:hypothetical protein
VQRPLPWRRGRNTTKPPSINKKLYRKKVKIARKRFYPCSFKILGILLTFVEGKAALSQQVEQQMRQFFGNLVFDTVIRSSISLAEAPSAGEPIITYDPESKGAADYKALAEEMITMEEEMNAFYEQEVKDKKVFVKGHPERFLQFRDILGGSMYKKGGPVIGRASINPEASEMDPKTIPGRSSRFFSTYTFATNIVEIEMAPDSGEISVIRAVGSNDCGTVINPDGAEGQMDGGMAIGLGYGLQEEIEIKTDVLSDNRVVSDKRKKLASHRRKQGCRT